MIAPGVTVEAPPVHKEQRLRYGFAQNVPLILALTILVVLSALYVGLFHGQLHTYPGIFEWTSIVNTAMPTVLVAVGQSIVVLTAGSISRSEGSSTFPTPSPPCTCTQVSDRWRRGRPSCSSSEWCAAQ